MPLWWWWWLRQYTQGRMPEITIQCIHHLRNVLPSASISVEIEKPARDGLTDLAAQADIVFYSRSWAEVNIPLLLEKHKRMR